MFFFLVMCCAECCSFTGVLKQNYGWFTVENSLWTTMAITLGSLAYFLAWESIALQHLIADSHPHLDLRFVCDRRDPALFARL